MKLYTQLLRLISLKFRSFLIAASLIASGGISDAAASYYTFDGTFTGFENYNPAVTFDDLGVVLGETRVSYTFEVDFDRATSTEASSAATWHYFYSDLRGPSVVAEKLNGIVSEEHQSFDAYFNSQPNLGELVGGSFVRILAWSSNTDNWRVQDWVVGQEFTFSDGTVPSRGGYAVYLNGDITLTSITAVPEPAPYVMIGSVLLGIPLWRACRLRRRPLVDSTAESNNKGCIAAKRSGASKYAPG